MRKFSPHVLSTDDIAAFVRPSSDVTSEQSTIAFNIYDRALDSHAFLGNVQFKPVLVHDHTVDQWYKCVRCSLTRVFMRCECGVTRSLYD